MPSFYTPNTENWGGQALRRSSFLSTWVNIADCVKLPWKRQVKSLVLHISSHQFYTKPSRVAMSRFLLAYLLTLVHNIFKNVFFFTDRLHNGWSIVAFDLTPVCLKVLFNFHNVRWLQFLIWSGLQRGTWDPK